MIRLTTYAEAREAYRSKELRQALYDEGDALMHGVIVNLHGADHLARRRLENRLFRRDTFAWYESAVIPAIIADVVAPAVAIGHGDVLALARRTMLTLALGVAGVDRIEQDGTPAAAAEIDRLYALMDRLAKASTVAHATGDKAAIVADGDAALEEFRVTYFDAARVRRLDLLGRHARGEIIDDDLPRDVLTTLLRNQDRLDLPEATVLREVAYFPWVGSHSTSNALVHAMHHVFTWIGAHPGDRERLLADELLLQRFVHESLRLHPASPETHRIAEGPVSLGNGEVINAGSRVIIDMVAANRDPAVWGADAGEFDPFRSVPPDASPWGYTFGHGIHACLGMELAGGLEPEPGGDPGEHLFGAITTMARILLSHGARPDPDRPHRLDPATVRIVFETYPVRFG